MAADKPTTTEIVTMLTCVILWIFIYIPVISYHLNKYRKRGTNMVYLLRYSNITVIQSILFIFKLIISIFSHASAVWIYDHTTTETQTIQAVVAYVAAFFLYCFVWKFWLLRYNIMLNKQILSYGWKQIINAQHTKRQNSFYPKHKRTLGNMYCSMYIFMIIAVITTTLYVLGNIKYDWYGDKKTNPYLIEIYAGWDYVFPFVLLLIIYFTTPHFEDNFYIHTEMKYIFICLCIQYIVYYGVLLTLSLMKPTDVQTDILWTLGSQIVSFVQFCTILISTYWVNNKCDAILENHSYEIYTIPNKLQLGLEQKHCIEIQPVETNTEKKPLSPRLLKINNVSESFVDGVDNGGVGVCLTLYEMLGSKMHYNAFINHLSKEYSVECLLSLTEMIQFREYLINKYFSKNGLYKDDKLRIKLASDIPISYIVQNKNWNDKEKAYKLYTKYVRQGSDLQINISAEQRQKYDNLMGNYCMFMENGTISNDELVSLFVPCCKQMIYLMIDSRKRFQQTPIYTKLLNKNTSI